MFSLMRAKSILRWSRYAFFITGVLTLGYVGYAVVDARLYQASENRRFQRALAEVKLSPASRKNTSPLPAAAALAAANREKADTPAMAESDSSRLGRIEIPTIGIAAMILEGVDDVTLRRAVGHIPGTSLPGQKGNVAIAGHRDTFFRGLRNVHKGDAITLTTLKGSYRYRVDSTEVVDPQNAEVLYESDDATLTLITCYPFNFVGSAPRRFIVRAHRSPG
ncbi:MAG: class D sortase [Acidobacteria bacterium]|nr:class D sortase [Acidobacteriota bacterium]